MPDHPLESINTLKILKLEPFVKVVTYTHGHEVAEYPLVFQIKLAQPVSDYRGCQQVLETSTKIGRRLQHSGSKHQRRLLQLFVKFKIFSGITF